MTRLALQVSSKIVEMVKQDKLVLPTLPEIALRVRDVAEDPNSSVKDIANIISRDPALTARILKVTNSPMIRSSKPINDIFAAVTRLGVAYTSNIAIGLAMEQMFQATSDVIDSRLRRTWAQALQVGASAEVLARHFTNIAPEKAMLAGIVHQIGVLPILASIAFSGAILVKCRASTSAEAPTCKACAHVLRKRLSITSLVAWNICSMAKPMAMLLV